MIHHVSHPKNPAPARKRGGRGRSKQPGKDLAMNVKQNSVVAPRRNRTMKRVLFGPIGVCLLALVAALGWP